MSNNDNQQFINQKERIEVIFKKILRYDFYINSTNAKASIIIAWNGIVIGTILLKYNSIISLYRIPEWAYFISNVLLSFIALTSTISIILIFQVINPFLILTHKKDKDSKSLLFFGSVAKMSFDEYFQKESTTSYKEILSDLTEQSYILAKGLNNKMKNMQKTIKAIFLQLLGLFLLILLRGVIIYAL